MFQKSKQPSKLGFFDGNDIIPFEKSIENVITCLNDHKVSPLSAMDALNSAGVDTVRLYYLLRSQISAAKHYVRSFEDCQKHLGKTPKKEVFFLFKHDPLANLEPDINDDLAEGMTVKTNL